MSTVTVIVMCCVAMKPIFTQTFSMTLVAALLVSGCKKKEAAPAQGSAVVTPPPAPDAAAPAVPATTVATADKLDAIALPVPTIKGAPAASKWGSIESTKDGSRLAYWGDGPKSWLYVTILDCNLPRMIEDAKKPVGERNGDASYCLDPFETKYKDYPMRADGDSSRTVKLGHLILSVGRTGNSSDTLKGADLEAYLDKLDLAPIAKL